MAAGRKRRVRRLVLRFYAERHLTLLLISFALTIAFTRLFLEISGYPQIGSSGLHLAHVLWGGLIWFGGSLLPLIFANQRAFDLSAGLIGIGSGLFMDEAGKFITTANDYFYPPAAPLIYGFFLLAVLLLQMIRERHDQTPRDRLYRVVEQFEELIEGDLSDVERNRLRDELDHVEKSDTNENLKILAGGLLDVVRREEARLVPHLPDLVENVADQCKKRLNQLFTAGRRPLWLFSLWACLGAISMVHPLVSFYVAKNQIALPWLFNDLLKVNLGSPLKIQFLEYARLMGEGISGLGLFYAAILGFLENEKLGAQVAYFSGLALLVIVNLLVFFFDQFSALVFTAIQLAVFLLTVHYRRIFHSN
jgi:hypothetical protein